jgi:hypothetical protein
LALALAGFADPVLAQKFGETTVLVVDTTQSGGTYLGSLGGDIVNYDALMAKSGAASSYGLMGFNSKFDANLGAIVGSNTVYQLNGGAFGTAANVNTALSGITPTRGRTDAYQALQYALSSGTYFGAYKPNNVRNVFLATDSFREAQYTNLDPQGLSALLTKNHAALTVLTAVQYTGSDGKPFAAVARDKSGTLYGFTSACTRQAIAKNATPVAVATGPTRNPLTASAIADVTNNFINVALSSGGLVADISQIGQGTGLSCALAGASIMVLQGNAGSVESAAIGSTTETALRTDMNATAQAISAHIVDVALRARSMKDGTSGASTWSNGHTTLWSDVTNTWTSVHQTNGAYDANTQHITLAADTLAFDNTIIGMAVGIDNASANLISAQGNQNALSVSVTPYIAMLLDDVFIFEAHASLARGSNDLTEAASGVIGTGKYSSWRYVVSSALSATKAVNDLILTAALRYSFGQGDNDAFTDALGGRIAGSSAKLQIVSFSGEGAYHFSNGLEPFAQVNLQQIFSSTKSPITLPGDLSATPAGSGVSLLAGLGIRYFLDQRAILSLQGAGEFLRAKERQYVVNGNVKLAF